MGLAEQIGRTTRADAAPERQSALTETVVRMERVLERARNVAERTSRLRQALFGPKVARAEPGKPGAPAPVPSAMFDQFNALLELASEELDRTQDELTHIEAELRGAT